MSCKLGDYSWLGDVTSVKDGSFRLGNDICNDITMDVRESKITAGMTVSKFCVIDAHEM